MTTSLSRLVLAACCFLLCALSPSFVSANNLVFIYVDDMNRDLGAYGHPTIQTPNIDQFAQDSVLFENAVATNPLCSPSRAGLLSGQGVLSTQVADNRDPFPEHSLNGVPYIPDWLGQMGYHTAGIGKIFHFPSDNTSSFDEQYDFYHDQLAPRPRYQNNRYDPTLMKWGPFENANLPQEKMNDTKRTDKAIELLRRWSQRGNQPFAIFVGYEGPHLPWIYPEVYHSLYSESDVLALPAGEQTNWRDSVQPSAYSNYLRFPPEYVGREEQGRIDATLAYMRTLTYIDDQIGRVLSELRNLNIFDETTVVLVSDHGYSLGLHGVYGKGKGWARDLVAPLLIKPKRSLAVMPNRVNRSVSHLDVYPTLGDLLGLPLPVGLEGRSLISLMTNPSASHPPAQFVTKQSMGGALLTRGIMDNSSGNTMKLMMWEGYAGGGIMKHQLYNLEQDPNEYNNLFTQPRYQTYVQRLEDRLRQEGLLAPHTRLFGPGTLSVNGGELITVQGIPAPGQTVRFHIRNPYPHTAHAALFKSVASATRSIIAGGVEVVVRDPRPTGFILPPEGKTIEFAIPSSFPERTSILGQVVISSDLQGREITSSRGISFFVNPLAARD